MLDRFERASCSTIIRVCFVAAFLFLLLTAQQAISQSPQPEGGGVRPGVLPKTWILGGPKCIEIPEFQIQEYNEDFYVLRQSGCSHYEKPFLYLLFGKDKVLLLDTGAGKDEVARVVKRVSDQWLARSESAARNLGGAHSRGRRGHTGGER